MPSIDIGQVAADALAAMLGILEEQGSEIAEFAESTASDIAESMAEIGELRATGVIDDAGLAHQINIQERAAHAALMAVEGMTTLAAERAVNAALSILTAALGSALGGLPGTGSH